MDDQAPKAPGFPMGTLMAAAVVDIAEWFDLSGVAYAITLPILLMFTGYLWLWMRQHGGKSISAMKGQATRLMGATFLEALPVINVVPWTVIFVLDAHRRAKKSAADAPEQDPNVTRGKRGSGPSDRPEGVTRSQR